MSPPSEVMSSLISPLVIFPSLFLSKRLKASMTSLSMRWDSLRLALLDIAAAAGLVTSPEKYRNSDTDHRGPSLPSFFRVGLISVSVRGVCTPRWAWMNGKSVLPPAERRSDWTTSVL